MIKRELIANIKGFIICTSVLVGMLLLVFLVYPYIITEENMQSMEELMKAFPEDVLKAFNMDIASIDTAYGWLKSEGYIFILLAFGIYSSILGINIVYKEENEKTIEYLGFLPIKRNKIMTNKIIVSMIYIFSMVIIIGLIDFIALLISCDFNKLEYLLLSISPLLISLPLFFVNLFLSTLFKHGKKMIGISLGLVFVFYFINMISEISSNAEFLKYFSIYTLADTRNIIANTKLSGVSVLISILLSGAFCFLSYYIYDKKELV